MRAGLLALLLGSAATPALAQLDACVIGHQACVATCRVAAALSTSVAHRCEAGCGPKLAECRAGAQRSGAPATPAPATAPPGDRSPLPARPSPTDAEPIPQFPVLTSSLEAGAIHDAVRAVEAIHKQRADKLLAATLAPPPPVCSGTGFNTGPNSIACAQARAERLAVRSTPEERAEIARQLLPLQPSMDLDLAALPADPMPRMEALVALGAKYQPAIELLKRMRSGTRPTGSGLHPMTVLMWSFDEPRLKLLQQTQEAPVYRQAWVEGRVPENSVSLDFLQRIEWYADRQTHTLLAGLRSELKGAPLFADRQTDLVQSAREKDQAASFATWGQPTDHEIGLALLRVFIVNNGRLATPFEAERTLPMTLLAAVLNAPVLDVQRLLHVQKTRPCVRTGDSFTCSVQLWLQLFQRGNGMRVWERQNQNPVIGLILAARADAMNQNGVPTEIVFKATAQGFLAPELAQRVRDSDERTLSAMNEASRSAQRTACLARQRGADRWNYLSPLC